MMQLCKNIGMALIFTGINSLLMMDSRRIGLVGVKGQLLQSLMDNGLSPHTTLVSIYKLGMVSCLHKKGILHHM